MYDWLEQLGPGDRVLDLASASGSFSMAGLACSVIAIDEDPDAFGQAVSSANRGRWGVVGRSERLPVASASIDLVVCNHGLEHIVELDAALKEIGRVLKPSGRLYIAVPDGYGLCDAVYRWAFEGGGHVNRFRRDELTRRIQADVGVRPAQWQKLYSGFNYLRGIPDLLDRPRPDLQKRLKRIARLPRVLIEAAQCGLYVATRLIDRALGTTLAVYGWAIWFDRGAGEAKENPPYVNVCLGCGAGHPPEEVRGVAWRAWTCTACGRRNPVWL